VGVGRATDTGDGTAGRYSAARDDHSSTTAGCVISSRHSSQEEPSRIDAGAASNDQANNFIVRCCCTTVKESAFRDRVRVLLANPVAGAQFLGGVLVMELESSSAGPGASAGDPTLRPLPVLLPPEHS
jgi:hypothetical protein